MILGLHPIFVVFLVAKLVLDSVFRSRVANWWNSLPSSLFDASQRIDFSWSLYVTRFVKMCIVRIKI